jgi:sterol desaturase/sphingolipid hydroxylase (fatty acid hydroxylase superfamily)
LFFNFRYQPMSVAALLHHNLVHLRDMAIGEFLSYFVFAMIFFLFLLWLKQKNTFRFRIRRSIGKPKQIGREFFNSIRSICVYNAIQLGMRLVVLAFGFIMTMGNTLPLWWVILSYPLVMIGHETYFYWTHRLMHHPKLFRLVHWEHHKSVGPTVFSAHSFSVIEAMVDGFYPILYVLIFPTTFPVLIFFQFAQILHDVAIHSGVDIFPRVLVTDKRFGWLCGTIHHDMHHALGRSNYALYTRVWDRLMKTEHPDFDRIYEYVHSPDNDGNAYKLLSRAARSGPALENA